MTDKNPLEALFRAGMSKEQFIAKYNELKETEALKENASSIFKTDLTNSIEALFDTIDTTPDNTLDENELAELIGYDTSDGDNTLSESDIAVLYKKSLQKITTQNIPTPEEMYKTEVEEQGLKPDTVGDTSRSTYITKLSAQINILSELINARRNESNSKLTRYQAELDNLIINESDLSREEKNVYTKNVQTLNKKKNELEEKKSELKQKEIDIETAKNELAYIRAKAETDDNDLKETKRWETVITNLTSEYTELKKDITKLNSDINSIINAQKTYTEKASSKHSNFALNKKRLEALIASESSNCSADITQYQNQISSLSSARTYAIIQSAMEGVTPDYSDSDTQFFSGDAQDLKNIWEKVNPNLSDGFYNKVIEISKRIGCDANSLMAVMRSESGISATARNSSSGATGLIQFMPKTAQSYGTTTEELSKMSPEQQLVYVEKYLTRTKAAAGFSADEKINQGQLYALVFLPAYAKREVLTAKGHKFYESNKGLDVDKDGQITLADLNARVERMKPKSIRQG